MGSMTTIKAKKYKPKPFSLRIKVPVRPHDTKVKLDKLNMIKKAAASSKTTTKIDAKTCQDKNKRNTLPQTLACSDFEKPLKTLESSILQLTDKTARHEQMLHKILNDK